MKLGKKRIFDHNFLKKNIDINKVYSLGILKKCRGKELLKIVCWMKKGSQVYTETKSKEIKRKDFKCQQNREMPIS